ncbi:glycoside hydrolase family 9 protein [Parvularcula sp. BGMRC 0090]|uniref:Endoglucanase n=1 Tax=Parvularcula maris TaxID=2965077 RepID=A0A9X2LAF1_9PROT|nr:glycoside hydrolase family 9 protein [Parvularcula maris]
MIGDAAAQELHLNQTGFEPGGAMRATLVSDAKEPVPFDIVASDGEVLGQGMTEPFGMDRASGQHVHRIAFEAPAGSGLSLKAGGAASEPFDVRPGIYDELADGALAFFYHQRASTPIEAEHVGEAFAREAGHTPDIAACPATDHRGNEWGGCPYKLDVSKGWYDAGDHGKYVVNGGISVWALMNAAERGIAGRDGSAAIPEAGNGVPDVLDEARWEMDFLLAMQVPEGTTLRLPLGMQNGPELELSEVDASGMAHHKVGDQFWTGLPTIPAEAPDDRALAYPSTAATLNLAAAAAQCARVFAPYDEDYAALCLEASERAYAAARRVPDAFATDVTDGGSGGYGDRNLEDEFYWAAAELFAATGKRRYRRDMQRSDHFLALPKPGQRDIAWPTVEALGTLTLLTTDSLPARERARAEAALLAVAGQMLEEAEGQGYGVPFDRSYVWGSNGDMANRGIILAMAAEATGDDKYRDGVVAIADYLLGRNPLGFSYVAGFGENAMKSPHHRFWMGSSVEGLPLPPPGALSGGANESPGAEEVASQLKEEGCAPMLCYADDHRAYSLNEVAINWNAPLYWIAAYLAATEAG